MTIAPEMAALKTRLKAMWMAGDYGHFARYLEPGAVEFLAGLEIEPGQRVLDAACGTGQLALPAARAGAMVTGIDIATNLIDQARSRAWAEGLDVRLEEGDVEDMPYDDAGFDLIVSLIGAMFAPRPERVVAEFIRLSRPGGCIDMGNWTPQGFVGRMFKTIGRHVPPPATMPSPVLWGDEDTVRARLDDGVADLRLARKLYPLEYPFPPAEVVEFFRAYYGPTNRAFAALDADGQAALRAEMEQFWSESNLSGDGGTRVDAEYLEVIARRV